MQAQPGFNQNQFSGTLASGAEGMISTLSLGSNMASGVSSSQANQKQASEAFQSNLTRGFSDGTSQAQTYSRLSNVGRTISSQGTEQSSLVDQQAKNFMEKFGVDQSHSDAVKGAVAMQASGSIDAGKFAQMLMPFVGKAAGAAAGKGGDSPVDVKAGVTGSSTSSADDSTTWTSGDVTQFAKGINYSQTDSQALTNQLAQGFSRSGGESFSHTWGDSLSQNLSKSASEVVSASNSFNTMSQLQNQVGSMTNTDFKTLGGAVAQSPAAMGQLNEYFRNAAPTAVKDEAGSLEQRYRSYGMSPEVAQSAARMTAMTNPSNYEPGKELGGFQSALQAINTASGRASGYSGDAYANSGLSTPNVSGLPSQVQGAVGAGPNIGPDFRGNTAATAGMNPESEVGQLPNNSPIVQQEHQSRAGSLDSKAQDTERRLSAPEVQNARDNLLNALPPMSWTASGWGSMDNGSDWMSRAGKSLIAGGEAGGAAFTQVTDQMRTMTPEQRDEFIATTQRGDDALQEQYGWQGEALVGAAKLGRGIMGATATGYDAAKEWMTGNSDLSEAAKGMNLEQRGAFYASALTAATEAGVDTTQQFMQQYGNEYKETMQSIAQSHYGLSQNQAAVFGQSFSTDKGQMDQAVNNLKMEYAERNPDGSPMIENGVPVLSQQNEEFTNQMVNVLQNASNAGDRAGSYLTPIRGYNITERGLDSKH